MINIGLGLGLPFKARSALLPSLSLTFAGSNTLDPRITFTRASSGTYFDSTGRLATAGNNVARFDYDPVTLAPRGLLIEEQRTNYQLQSGNLSAVGSSTGATLGTATVAPDATTSGIFVVEDTSTGGHARGFGVMPLAVDTAVTLSVFLKAGGRTRARLELTSNVGASGCRGSFDLSTGTMLGTGVIGSPVGLSATQTMTNAGNGWWRCTLTVQTGSTGNATYGAVVNLIDTGVNVNYTGNGTSGVYMWGAQLEVGAFATSPIITTTATATRAADSAVMTGTNFSSWYNQSAGTFVAEFTRFGIDVGAGSVALVQADDNSSNNRVALRLGARTATPQAQSTIVSGGSVLLNEGLGSISNITGVTVKAGMTYQVGIGAVGRDGVIGNNTSIASLPTTTQLNIAQGSGAVALNGHMRSLRFYSSRLPNATLQSLTT